MTCRAACHGSGAVRAPPANAARPEVNNRRPVGWAGSSGIDTGALKWQGSPAAARWLVSSAGTTPLVEIGREREHVAQRLQHLLLDLEIIVLRGAAGELGLEPLRGRAVECLHGVLPRHLPLARGAVAAPPQESEQSHDACVPRAPWVAP